MTFKCPGASNFFQPKPENINCPYCSYDVEIWTDEIKTKCPKCKKVVYRPMEQSCVDWCKYAKECIGEVAYKKYLHNKKKNKKP